MESRTNRSLLGKDHLITNSSKIVQIIINHNRYSVLNVSLTIRAPFLAVKALWLIRFSLNEIPSSGCSSSFTLLSITSSPCKVISGTNVHSSSKYTTMMHARLFQRSFNNSKYISCGWYCQCSSEYFHLCKTHLQLRWLLYDVSGKNVRLTSTL